MRAHVGCASIYLFTLAKYALVSSPTTDNKFPIVRLASIRCRPQSSSTCPFTTTSPEMSLVRAPPAVGCRVTARYEPCSSTTQTALKSPGTLTKGVVTGFSGVGPAEGTGATPEPGGKRPGGGG